MFKGVLLESPELDVHGQMALDEALLSAAAPETVTLRFYRWTPGVAVTFGYFQRFDDVLRSVAAARLAVDTPLARRPTGGGVVVHDGDVTFSLVFPWGPTVTPTFVYKDLHRGVHLGLKAQGLVSRLWSPQPKPARPTERYREEVPPPRVVGARPIDVCFAGPSPMDLVHEDGTKFLGGALRKRGKAGLYQGSLRVEGFGLPGHRLVRAVVEGLSLEWRAAFVPRAVDQETFWESERLKGERYATREWNQRR